MANIEHIKTSLSTTAHEEQVFIGKYGTCSCKQVKLTIWSESYSLLMPPQPECARPPESLIIINSLT